MAKNTKTVAGGSDKVHAAYEVKKARKGKGGKGKSVAVAEKVKVKKVKEPPPARTFKLVGVGKKGTGNATSAEGADGVTRTRAQWNGYSLSSLLKWVGANGGTITNARQLVKGLGLADVTSASTVSCQYYAGVAYAAGTKQNHPGDPADVQKEHKAALKVLAGM